MKIEVKVPDGMDLDHTYQAVMDAMYNADNVSKQEVLLVSSLLNQLASKKAKLPKGFREWAHTHYEVVSILEGLQQDLDNIPRVLGEVLERDYVSSIYDLSIDLTNEFCNTYENRIWGIETIQEFIKEKLQ